MALRSVLRKMPALGLRSPPPMVPPVRALSPAAGSRPMSHAAPAGAETVTLEQELSRMNANMDKRYEELFDRMRSSSQFFSDEIAKNKKTKKELEMQLMAANAAIALGVSANLYMLYNF